MEVTKHPLLHHTKQRQSEREKKMQSLQQKASEWSGVQTVHAFAIDDTNLFQKLGLQSFVKLSTNFYNRVYDDEEEWFRSIFANSDKENAIQNQYEFLVQRMGGPPLYSQRRGHPALIARHRQFPVTHQAAERWLHHMKQALDSTSDIDDDSRIKMMNFFRHTAYFLVAGVELKNQNLHPCKDAPGRHPYGKIVDGSAKRAEKERGRLSGSHPVPRSKFIQYVSSSYPRWMEKEY